MKPTKADTLKVPGASLYYEIRGSGPVLLLICGGVYDADGYAGLAQQLTDRYTVVTYDRRGNSRSPLDGPVERQSMAVHGDDARQVLSAVGVTSDEAAYVFGNSSGAIIGLELATRHPELVRSLVGHEPPLFDLLPDREHFRAVLRDVEEAFGRQGAQAAHQVLGAGLQMGGGAEEDGRVPGGADAPPAEPGPEMMEMMEMMARMAKNSEFFIGYEVPGFAAYTPDFVGLKASSAKIVMAVGEASEGEPPYRAAFAVAEQLGTRTVVFPGDHGGFGAQPEAFAVTLDHVLSGR